ncbi:hypothetical protein SAMN05192533_11264 [Mesobacillus persicus]|uniref:Xaa-Pro dipeptidyl-peptidase C-terminal domain-containing protein n=1 Tax=Mesobacillus persicus TaxID=930146 RepID=A0A1H8G363_9BACI|nr:CocE/NonD family hydrolase [Mesobacillus persicus]SEN38220.1 hypothetical protein SAMN05192533_11264 [Mesobacillus persicus]
MSEIIVEREVPCVMRDGVTLYATVYRPKSEGQFPVVLTRLPYNKNLPNFSHRYIDPMRMVLGGYVVIIQDVRGRFASEGEFEPGKYEAQDGYDTVEWAASLPYSNGKVGMFGLSYYGFTQLYALQAAPPSLKAIVPAMTGNISGQDVDRHGVCDLASAQTWILDSVAPDYLKRQQGNGEKYAETLKDITNDLNHIDEWHKHIPFENWPPIMKHPEMRELYKKHLNSELLTHPDRSAPYTGEIPAYHIAGWYDNFLAHTIKNFEEMSTTGSVNNQKLIIGAWAHGVFHSEIGERFFGINSSGDSIGGKEDITSLHLDWFNFWLKEDGTSLPTDEEPVRIFTMGVNEWRSEKEWPLQRTVYTPFYLHSEGTAHLESGGLSLEGPDDEPQDQYVYDPEDPVPTHGGGILFYNGRNSGPRDQRKIEERKDVLVYTSEPMVDPLEVTGWIKVQLWASTDAPDTDFTAKLIDVYPDGRAYNLTDGIVRAKYREGSEEKAPLTGEIVPYEIDLWATSNVFLPGHSIRLEISSSNFPRYDVNPNTGNTTKDTVEMVKATQTIYHDSQHPSHVLLPVIPAK